MARAWSLRSAVIASLAAAVSLGWLFARARAIDRDLGRPRALEGVAYAGSRACRACHPANYASWHHTFHRTMTQRASAESVLGDFEHGELSYLGVAARMRRDARGHFTVDFARENGREQWSVVIERTVGSRRYQQYLARDRDVYYRLPIAWNVEEGRFMHMNEAFLTPDPEVDETAASVAREDYDRHVTRWNDNCIYCHNVGANPGLDTASGTFASKVAELGIACEACHGPGSRHVHENRDPWRRFALHLSGREDPTITNPARLSSARSAQVCGHCHGQRLAPQIERVHREGDRYVPGEDLGNYSKPLARDTTLDGVPGAFAARFWPDGTARLTAYEYQGLLQSACARRGALTCTSCHGMHEGDPRAQLRQKKRGDEACTGCHLELALDAAKQRHAHHDARGPGARCTACHMPQVVYGLVGVHRSHRIDVPEPGKERSASRPDACSLCHVDKSRSWAAAALASWKQPNAPRAAAPNAGLPEAAELLLAGDPIERAVAAFALGRPEASAAGAAPNDRLSLLFAALENDRYPAVRSIAWRSLRTLLAEQNLPVPALSAFTPAASRPARASALAKLRTALPEARVPPLAPAYVVLHPDPNAAAIFIGE